MSKLLLLAAGATGYVLGAKAGRERYDQIVNLAQSFWTDPRVQKANKQAQDYARDKAPEVGEKFGEAAKKAGNAMHVSGGHNGQSGEVRTT